MQVKLKDLTYEQKTEKNSKIYTTLFNRLEWKNANVVAMTISTEIEIDTFPIIAQAWKEGKVVAVPKCIPSIKALDFRKFDSYEQLEVSYSSLKEPNPLSTSLVKKQEIDLVIVPGIVFDQYGFRIGYGGGYYDRFLSTFKGNIISLAYDFQVIEKVPTQHHDMPVNMVVTEEKVYKCSH